MTEPWLAALDTNVVVYAEGFDDIDKMQRAHRLIAALGPTRIVMPTQVLGEAFNTFRRKGMKSERFARTAVENWRAQTNVHAAGADVFDAALDLATNHNLQFWDALILATSADARCRLLLSEDLRDGFVFRGVTVANPFLETLHPLLRDALEA